jgi:hypothetical protein
MNLIIVCFLDIQEKLHINKARLSLIKFISIYFKRNKYHYNLVCLKTLVPSCELFNDHAKKLNKVELL